jgi:hypothetical protein
MTYNHTHAYTVQKLIDGKWVYYTNKGTWDSDILKAKTWQRVKAADKISFKHFGSITFLHKVQDR